MMMRRGNFFLNNVGSIVNYAGTILKTIKMIYLENFYNCSQIFANILRLHFNYAGTVSKTMRMIYLGNNCNCIIWNLYCFFVKFKRYKYMIFFTFCFLLSLSHKYKMVQQFSTFSPTSSANLYLVAKRNITVNKRKKSSEYHLYHQSELYYYLNQIATNVFIATGFVYISDQCHNKWNMLKRGYENMERIL